MYLYRTYFNLTNEVIDFEDARMYLISDDMSVYLKDDDRIAADVREAVVAIKWLLSDESSGHIDLTTTKALSENELNSISDWVCGQNSDGLGEGFEQQDFASYEVLDDYEDDDDDYGDEQFIMASFDWKTNEYLFTEVSNYEK